MTNVKLGSVITEASPGFACGKEDPSGIFQMRMHNVNAASDLDLAKRRRVPTDAVKNMDRFSLNPHDLLFNSTNSPENVGKSIFVPELDEPCVYSNHFLRLRTSPAAHPKYVWRYLQWQYMRGTFRHLAKRWVNQATVSKSDLLKLEIPVPPIPEQRRIAAILDQADALRAKRREQLALLDALPQAIFYHMFMAEPLPPTTIGDLASDIQYGTSDKAGSQGDYPILRMGNITDLGALDLTDLKYLDLPSGDIAKYTTRRGDLLFNRTNSLEKVGKAAVVHSDQEFAIAGYLVRVRFPHHGLADYVAAFLNGPSGRSVRRRMAKVAVNQANISAGQMRQIALPHPDAAAVAAFAEKVAFNRHQQARALEALHTADTLFTSLQSRAFRGEL